MKKVMEENLEASMIENLEKNLENENENHIPYLVKNQQPLHHRPPASSSFKTSTSTSNSDVASERKFDLGEVEIWIVLASIFGALLALVTFQLCRLCKIRVFNKKTGGDICHIESQKVIDSVIQDGIQTVSKTKKVVVMNIHLVPCSHHPNYLPQTELTPNGAIMMQAKTCRANITNNKHLPMN